MKYIVSDTAGRDIAPGIPNPGTGKPVELSDGQAEQPLRVGHINRPVEKKQSKPSGKTK